MRIFARLPDSRRLTLYLGKVIGHGKEGDVYLVDDEGELCAKIYRNPSRDISAHLGFLMNIDSSEWYVKGSQHLEVAWPLAVCENATSQVIGFLMNALSGRYLPAQDLFDPVARAHRHSLNWGYLVGVATDLARIVAKLHKRKILAGDIALPNLMASVAGRVSLLDCDSFVIKHGKQVYGGATWRRDNGPPEGGPGRHTRETDHFALAVVICELLMEQYHPFCGVDTSAPSDDERDQAANIARGRSWLFHSSIRTPRMCPPRELLPAPARDLAYLAFERGTEDPGARPDAATWYGTLAEIAQNLERCGRSAQHVYYAEEWTTCPWCERQRTLAGHDPFPARELAPTVPPWLRSINAELADTAPNPVITTDGTDRPRQDQPQLAQPRNSPKHERAWGTIEKIKEEDGVVTGTVIEVVKGGLILDIGLRGFLPASLVEMRRVRDLQPYVGREIEAKIIELDKNRNNVVLSRRAWLEQTQSEVRQNFLNTLQKGQIRKGVVSSIVNFGAFVDLGGVDGLVHVSELSWKHIDHPGEVVEVGQEVTVEVLDVDMDRERVSLSLKSTQEDPWQQFARTHQIGQVVPGRVTKLVPFGSFVRVEEGIEGLVHISELADRHVEIPEQVVQVGDEIFVKIIDIDLDRRRISLSLKQANEGTIGEKTDHQTLR